jgi:uroporphyrinogen-III synthase
MVRRARTASSPAATVGKQCDNALGPPHIIVSRHFDKDSFLKHVLITRPEPGASQTAIRLSALGHFPIIAPILSIELQAVCTPAHWAATVLTSQNAVRACPPSTHDRLVFAVGTATASEAVNAGFSHVHNAEGDAKALVALIASALSPKDGTLLLPTAQGQGAQLATSLRQRGFRVLRRVAYRAAPVPSLPAAAVAALGNGPLSAVMFFSGETSRHFVRLLKAANLMDRVLDVEAMAISERTAVPLRGLQWRRIQVAAKPNQDAMLALLL